MCIYAFLYWNISFAKQILELWLFKAWIVVKNRVTLHFDALLQIYLIDFLKQLKILVSWSF